MQNKDKGWKEKIIIDPDNKVKAVFDITLLLLVGYSCVTSVFYVAFSATETDFATYFDPIVEFFFILDLCLNFIQGYIDLETYSKVEDMKKIAQ